MGFEFKIGTLRISVEPPQGGVVISVQPEAETAPTDELLEKRLRLQRELGEIDEDLKRRGHGTG